MSSVDNLTLAEQITCETAILMFKSPVKDKTMAPQKHGTTWKNTFVANMIYKPVFIT